MPRTILLVVGALIAGALLTVGGLFAVGLLGYQEPRGTEETTTASSATKAPAQTDESPKTTPQGNKSIPPMTAVAGMGETTDMGDRTITVNDTQHGYVFPSNIPSPAAGDEFVLANITITNTSAQPITINMLHFKSEDSSGVRRNAQAVKQAPNPIPAVGSIAPGGELTGTLALEVQQNDPVIKVVYNPR
jgi:Domain of unknown function (DUF4352)